MGSSPCFSIKGDLNPRISQSAFAQFALPLTSYEFICGSASSAAEALLAPAAPTALAAVCGWPNRGAGGSTVGAGGTGGVHKGQPSSPEVLRILWKLPIRKSCRTNISSCPWCTEHAHKTNAAVSMDPRKWQQSAILSRVMPITLLQDGDWEINLVPLLSTRFNLLNSKLCQT